MGKMLHGRGALLSMFKRIHLDRLLFLRAEQKRDLRESKRRQVDRQDEIYKHQERLESSKEDR